ncbi:hypothetical protein BWQ96_08796 [Gracilariopsis chorda]|uniref:Brix domain-containing protein n=1 Tax=Gracilariopsis chorda TaxID=448386 RepID=A0A2V3IHF4_9FLOR|nr:hypothetical protein BWQ96_08796 [Gracilariopsis chorda]|eukprot:PXF41489.1 hypothetical protein BWQ96_08796 [Gracilariopsis chorda]
MLRREARLRREYLYRKSLEGRRAADFDRRVAIRSALADGKRIPTELRNAEARLRHSDSFIDAQHDAPRTHVDDEYASATHAPPRVLVTTSRSPSSRLSQFAKELRLLFPNAQRLNRGSLLLSELVSCSCANGFTDVIVAHETRGQPDGLVVTHLPYGPTAFFNVSNCVMRHDVQQTLRNVSEAYPHLIFHNFNSALAQRVTSVLKHLFPAPKQHSRRVITFANFDDTISVRHHTFTTCTAAAHSKNDVQLTEAGPRFELQLYQLRLGTMDNKQADNEWVVRSHMSTARKRSVL